MAEDLSDERMLSFYSQRLLTLLKISGAIPIKLPKNEILKVLAFTYMFAVAVCCVYTVLETGLFLVINMENNKALYNNLWIKVSLLISDVQLIGFFSKREQLRQLMSCRPQVVKSTIATDLKKCVKKATKLGHLIIWTYIFISFAASLSLEFRTNIFKEEESAPSADEDVLLGLFHSSAEDYVKEIIKYIHYGSFFYFGLFQLVSVMLYIHICCFVQGYADHLADTISCITFSAERSSEKRTWPSYQNCDVFDIRYVATMHQYVIGLIVKVNDVYSLQMQLKMWRIIIILVLTAKEITDHAELSRQSLVHGVEFVTNMWELFIFCWLAENLSAARDRFREEILYKLMSLDNIHSADYSSLQIMSHGSNIKYTLRAGPFYKFSNKTFNAITAVSYTYYSFLRNVKA